LMGLQLILAFLAYDIASVPRRPIHRQYVKQ
jgi:dolichol-phosphate mannosyltransferase